MAPMRCEVCGVRRGTFPPELEPWGSIYPLCGDTPQRPVWLGSRLRALLKAVEAFMRADAKRTEAKASGGLLRRGLRGLAPRARKTGLGVSPAFLPWVVQAGRFPSPPPVIRLLPPPRRRAGVDAQGIQP